MGESKDRSTGTNPPWDIQEGDGPVVATAVHDGHELRDEVRELMILDEVVRLREEDPYTGQWTQVADTRIVPRRSRFEVDLNRPREEAVFLRPEDAWGLEIWKSSPPAGLVERSLAEHDAFYQEMQRILADREARFGRFCVLDLHSYNHRREGPDGPVADPEQNPEVNVGTGSMDPVHGPLPPELRQRGAGEPLISPPGEAEERPRDSASGRTRTCP